MNSKIAIHNSTLALTLSLEMGSRKFFLSVNSTGTWVLVILALLVRFAPYLPQLIGSGP